MRNHSRSTLILAASFLIFGMQALAQPVSRDSVTQEPKPSYVRIVFFIPSDLATPNGVRQRLTQIAETTDAFFAKWMKRWGYPAVAKSLFQRKPDGLVEVLTVRGDMPVAPGSSCPLPARRRRTSRLPPPTC